MLRSKLTFDQLVGDGIQYGEDHSSVRSKGLWGCSPYSSFRFYSSALCSDHVMRSGRHFTVFSGLPTWNGIQFGIVRPIQINRSDFADGELSIFSPSMAKFREYCMSKRTERWGDSTVHCCAMGTTVFSWYDWTSNGQSTLIGGFQH